MRFTGIKIRDLGPLGEVNLDLAAINGTLVAVCGDNGAGKSTLLELLPGALYRATPTRGSLVDNATSRHAMVEVTAVNGAAYTVRQTVDAVSGKGEALVLDAAGEPQVSTGKVRDADAWVRAHFPPPELLYSSTFMAQQSEGFLELAPGARKAVLLKLLEGGITKLEKCAQAARERASEARAMVQIARSQLDVLRSRYPELKQAKSDLITAEMSAGTWSEAVKTARAQLDLAKQHEAERARMVEIAAQRGPLLARIKDHEPRIAETRERIKNNHWLLDNADAIRAAVAELERLRTEKFTVEHDHTVARVSLAATRAKVAELYQVSLRADRAHDAALSRYKSTRERVSDAAEVRRDVEALPVASAGLKDALKAVRELDESIERTEESLRTGKDDRIAGLREGLETIASAKKPHRFADGKVAEATLGKDDAAALSQRRGPAKLAKLHRARVRASDIADRARDKLAALKESAARARDLAKAEVEFKAAEVAEGEALTHAKSASAAHQAAVVETQRADEALRTLAQSLDGLGRAIAKQEPKCKHAAQLEVAEAKLEALLPLALQLETQLAADREQLAALPVIVVPDSNLQLASDHLAHCEETLREAHDTLTHAKIQLKTAHEGASILAEHETGLAQAEGALSNWTRLAQDCGKDGIQAFVVDACLPELNELANDLLHACFGLRFTVELRSSRDAADGRVLEDLSVHVMDTVGGFAGPAERYSGGQRVIIGEAIALALTMLACRIAGLHRPTLVRDESGAALAPGNARAYLTMLRRAAQIVQADKVFFVSHNPELQSLADARIEVGEGTAVITHN